MNNQVFDFNNTREALSQFSMDVLELESCVKTKLKEISQSSKDTSALIIQKDEIIYDKFLDSAKKIWDNGMLQFNANTGLKYCEPDSSLRNALDLGCIEYSLEDMFKDNFYKEALISVLIGSKKTSENRENVERFIYYITYQ